MAQYFAGHGPEQTYDSSHVAPFSTLEHPRTLAVSSDFSTKPKLERELQGNGPNRRGRPVVLGSPPPPSRSRNRRAFDVNPPEAGAHFRSPALQGKPSAVPTHLIWVRSIPASAGSLCKLLTGCDLYALCGGRSHSVPHSVRVDCPVFGPAPSVFLVPRYCCAGRGVAVDGADVDLSARPGSRRESERFALGAPRGRGFPESCAHRNALR